MEAKKRVLGNHSSGVHEKGDAASRQRATLQDLPNEILEEVFSLLPVEDLALRVRRVCRRWRDIVDEGGAFRRQVYKCDIPSSSPEDVVRVLRAAPKLRRISLNGRTSPAVLRALCENCRDLRRVELSRGNKAILEALVDACPHLEWIYLHGMGALRPSMAMHIGRCRGLKEMRLEGMKIPAGALSAVADGCPHLQCLDILNCSCDLQDLSSILERRGAELTSLGLRCCSDQDCCLRLVDQHCTALQTLAVRHVQETSEALVSLLASAVARRLWKLQLFVDNLDTHAMAALFNNCSRLTYLQIMCCKEIDDTLTGITKLENLLSLDLSLNLNLTDAGVAHVTRCTTLKKLSLNFCDLISEESFRLCCENLPHLQSLQMVGTTVSSELLLTVPYRLKQLKNLFLSGYDLEETVATIKRQMPDLNLRLRQYRIV